LVPLLAFTAHALSVDLHVDGGASSVTIGVSTPYPGAAQSLSPAGAGSGEAQLGNHLRHGEYIASMSSSGVGLVLGSATIVLDAPAGIDLTLEVIDLGATLFVPEVFTLAVAPGRSLFDLVGSTLSLDQGMLHGTGSQLGEPVAFEWDLSLDPLTLFFGQGAVGTAQITSGELFAARLDLPLNLQTSIFAGPAATEFVFNLQGTASVDAALVPEPGTALLVAIGLAVLAGSRRQGVV
jgi:hypothetical protein